MSSQSILMLIKLLLLYSFWTMKAEVLMMPKVLTNGKIKAGAYRFSDKRRIALCIEEGNAITICGYFTSEEHAEFFMDKVAECVGQNVDCGGADDAAD